MLPRAEIGRTPDANTTLALRVITVRAESYDGTPDIGHSRKYSTVSPFWRRMSAKRCAMPPFCSSAYAISASLPRRPRHDRTMPVVSRASVMLRTAMSSAASWERRTPTMVISESSGTVRRRYSPRRCLISSTRRTEASSRASVYRPCSRAVAIALSAESGSAGISSRSEPARNARTVASPAPYLVTIAPIVSASVTTRPRKCSESRSTPVSTAADSVAGSSDPVSAGKAMCALITTSAPAAIPARNGTSSRVSSRR